MLPVWLLVFGLKDAASERSSWGGVSATLWLETLRIDRRVLRLDVDGQRVRRGGVAGRGFAFDDGRTLGWKEIFSESSGRESGDNEEETCDEEEPKQVRPSIDTHNFRLEDCRRGSKDIGDKRWDES